MHLLIYLSLTAVAFGAYHWLGTWPAVTITAAVYALMPFYPARR